MIFHATPSGCIQFESPTVSRIKEIVNGDHSFSEGLCKVCDTLRGELVDKYFEQRINHLVNSYLQEYFFMYGIDDPHWHCVCELDRIEYVITIRFNTMARVLITLEEAQRRIDEHGQDLRRFEEREEFFIIERNLRLQEALDKLEKGEE